MHLDNFFLVPPQIQISVSKNIKQSNWNALSFWQLLTVINVDKAEY